MSNIYLLERGGANAAKYFANIRTLLVETNLSEEELGRARITDNHKHINILDERTSHVHFTKLDKERMEVVARMLDQHADKDIILANGGRWCMNALMQHGTPKDIDRAIDRGLDTKQFTQLAVMAGNTDAANVVKSYEARKELKAETQHIDAHIRRAPRM